MTYQQIFIQIISEVSVKSEKEVFELVKIIRSSKPGGRWDKEIPENEAKELITKLRSDAPGIMAWLIKGAMNSARFESRTLH